MGAEEGAEKGGLPNSLAAGPAAGNWAAAYPGCRAEGWNAAADCVATGPKPAGPLKACWPPKASMCPAAVGVLEELPRGRLDCGPLLMGCETPTGTAAAADGTEVAAGAA